MKKKLSPGCLIALIIVGGLGLLIVVHLVIAAYFLMSKFQVRDVEFPETVAEQPVKVTSSDGAYTRDGAEQLYGIYLPKTELAAGKFVVAEITLGQQSEFAEIHSPGDVAAWAPVMIVVADTSKPEESPDFPSKRFSVLPAAYSVVGDKITFRGKPGPAGEVSFSGTLDLEKVKPLIKLGEASDETVLTGDLTLNGQTFKGVEFTYFPGD